MRAPPIVPDENFVFGFCVPSIFAESEPEPGMIMPPIRGLAPGIQAAIKAVENSMEAQRSAGDGLALTVPNQQPHVMVISTGRCGTMSLWHLLRESNLAAYHSYWWIVEAPYRHEMQARIQAARFDDLHGVGVWASTRAVEWMGACLEGRPMIGLNHLDTVFAPVFAAIHPLSRFVWLRRDAQDVFRSFYGKRQWGLEQLRPIRFAFDPFRYADGGFDLIPALAWYVRFTEAFGQAMADVLGERVLAVDADKLFAGHRSEISSLLQFIGADLSVDDAVEHFKTPINVKAHKACRIPDETWQEFMEAM